jgi:hypothetical protein
MSAIGPKTIGALCERALAIDPNKVRALIGLGTKFFALAQTGASGDPEGDLERVDESASKALALDPDSASRLEGGHPWVADALPGIRRARFGR